MSPNLQETVDSVTFTKEVMIEKLHFFVQCLRYSDNLENCVEM